MIEGKYQQQSSLLVITSCLRSLFIQGQFQIFTAYSSHKYSFENIVMQISKIPFMGPCYRHDKGTTLSDTEQDDD